MQISFFGHADFSCSLELKNRLITLLTNIANNCDSKLEFFFGEYGAFDSFAYDCCKKINFSNAKFTYVLPYLTTKPIKQYNEIVYPPLENVPKRLAIIKRNEWIVNNSDLIIFYVNRNFGGAYRTFEYAKRKNKAIYNLAQ